MRSGLLRKVVAMLAVGAALLVAGCGKSSFGGDGSATDRAFVAQMIPHHESGVEMAKIARRRGTSAFVRRLAADIVRTQTAEIATMRAADKRLKAAGAETGKLGVPRHQMGMDVDLPTLKTARPFSRAFMQMMLPHHEGAIAMAKAELAKGEDRQLRNLARDIIATQQREAAAMRKQLATLGIAPVEETDATHEPGHSG